MLGGLARACLCWGRGREGGTHKHTKAVGEEEKKWKKWKRRVETNAVR